MLASQPSREPLPVAAGGRVGGVRLLGRFVLVQVTLTLALALILPLTLIPGRWAIEHLQFRVACAARMDQGGERRPLVRLRLGHRPRLRPLRDPHRGAVDPRP